MTKLNPRIEPIQCMGCGHILILFNGMYHHVFENRCNHMCDRYMNKKSYLRELMKMGAL